MKTLKQLAQDAIDVQDASNLCGVAQSFAKAMVDLAPYTNSTKARNQHPITRMWVHKLCQLADETSPGYMTLSEQCKAIDAVNDLAAEET